MRVELDRFRPMLRIVRIVTKINLKVFLLGEDADMNQQGRGGYQNNFGSNNHQDSDHEILDFNRHQLIKHKDKT